MTDHRDIDLTSETESDRSLARRRLRHNGATETEIESFLADWDRFEGGVWTPEIRAQWLRMRDGDIRRDIVKTRDEYQVGTVTEEDNAVAEHEAAVVLATNAALDVIDYTPGRILEWVGDDRVCADAVLRLENDPQGQHRSGLIEALQEIAG